MIDFEIAPLTKESQRLTREFNLNTVRRVSRYYDEHEHEEIKEVEEITEKSEAISRKLASLAGEKQGEGFSMASVIIGEERCWGDAALNISISNAFVGNMVVGAIGSPEQKARTAGKFVAFAITEPGCGSDTSAIQTTAQLDPETNEWVINGEKIFITGGRLCEFAVVWATLDRSLGRAAIKSFLIENNNPGMTVTKLENKLGFRASDTVTLVFEDCRIPYDDILGSPEIKPKTTSKTGFKSVMATFDASRPAVAALAVGIGQAALDFTKEKLEQEGFTFPYDRGQHALQAIQASILDMEANIEAARLLTWRSASMLETGQRNSLEASMAKSKAGRTATLVTEKCVELLGPLGYSRNWLVEKWMRDCKVTDIFEGTGQINSLIIARNILGFSRDQLK
ncbi:MAG: acyl-CoA dehydrogenase family protein [Deltaproteobacteria bacterium]|nr:acyl-CoA dehydrogenase family protein [Deltaproteobacteria bacterium]MBW2085134.1 acyl-CoA dehydrogenase family protein [Deltaproteobacteria bacterium]